MGSRVSIYNATNLSLDMALSQVGPLYYENKVLPGQCFRRDVGKVWFTIEAKCYTGEENIYSDWGAVKPILAYPLVIIGAAASAGTMFTVAANEVAAMVGTEVQSKGLLAGSGAAGTVLSLGTNAGKIEQELTPERAKAFLEKLSLKSPGWYFGSDRTLYICGGPPASEVTHVSKTLQSIAIGDDNVAPLYITETCPAGFGTQ